MLLFMNSFRSKTNTNHFGRATVTT